MPFGGSSEERLLSLSMTDKDDVGHFVNDMQMTPHDHSPHFKKPEKVFTVGVFDMLHFGHFELFRRARELANGGTLTVAIQDDDYVLRYKPGTRLVYPLDVRIAMVSALRMVDRVVVYRDVDEIVKRIPFDVFVVGGDQTHDGFVRAIRWCESNGKRVVRLERTKGISSTSLRKGFP